MDAYRAAVTDFDDKEDKAPIAPTTAAPSMATDGLSGPDVDTPASDTPPATPVEKTGTKQSNSTHTTTASEGSVEDLGVNFLSLLRDVDADDMTSYNEMHGARHADGSVHYSIVFNPNRIQCPVCDMRFANQFAYEEHRKLACDASDGSASGSDSRSDSNWSAHSSRDAPFPSRPSSRSISPAAPRDRVRRGTCVTWDPLTGSTTTAYIRRPPPNSDAMLAYRLDRAFRHRGRPYGRSSSFSGSIPSPYRGYL